MIRNVFLLAVLISTVTAQQVVKHHENDHFILRRARSFYGPRMAHPAGLAPRARDEATQYMKQMYVSMPEFRSRKWRPIGPRPTIVLSNAPSAGPPIASGRVTSIAVHPTDPDIVYLGAANGGVWKTTNGGGAWTPLTDDQDSLAIGALAIDPSHPNTVYAGTGEDNFSSDSYFGAGILKTIDAGRTWTMIGKDTFGTSPPSHGGSRIGGLAVNPRNSSVLLAAVEGPDGDKDSGIYRSIDAGLTWRLVLKGAPGTSVVFDPKNPRIAYAGLGGRDPAPASGIYKSINGGHTWSRSGSGVPPEGMGRVSLTIAQSRPDVLYAAIANATEKATSGVFKSIDAGATWSTTNAPASYCQPTCWYANSIQVSPSNPDLVLIGGLSLNITRDGGATWNNVSEGANGNLIHWDIHSVVFGPAGRRVYIGTDGGIYRGGDIGSIPVSDIGWNNINDTLAITQFYPGCSSHPEFADFIICGTQDNGTQVYTGGNTWRMIAGGDGGFTAIDLARPSVYYYSAAGSVSLNKSSPFTRYKGFLDVDSGLQGVDTDDCFIPPLALDPGNSERLYFACRHIYRSLDGGGIWTKVLHPKPPPSKDEDPAIFTYIAVSPVQSDRVYAASSDGKMFVSSDATASGGGSWTERSTGLPGRPISSVVADFVDPSTAYVTVLGFSSPDSPGHVFKTADAGVTWKNMSAKLPNIAANIITLNPGDPKIAFLGTDVGVFITRNGGTSWVPLGSGLPNSPVVDLELHPSAGLLRAATHGRSMWELRLPQSLLSPLKQRIHSASAKMEPTPLAPVPEVTIKGSGFAGGTVVRWNGVERETKFIDPNTLHVSINTGELLTPGRTTLSVRSRGSGTSNFFNMDTGAAPTADQIDNGAFPTPAGQTPSLAPGSIAILRGSNLASHTSTSPKHAPAQTIAGAIVEFRSVITHLSYPAGLLSASPTEIKFLVPLDLPLGADIPLDVVVGTRMSKPKPVNITGFSPGLFTVDETGQGQGEVRCVSDGKIAGTVSANSRPAQPGESITIRATGLGPYFDDDEGTHKHMETIASPTVTIGGVPAMVSGSQAKSPFTGFYEVTVVVPKSASSPSGPAVPVTLTTGGLESNTVTIAIE